MGLANVDAPVVSCVTRLVHQKGIHLIKHAAWRTLERGGQFVLLGSAPDPRVQVGVLRVLFGGVLLCVLLSAFVCITSPRRRRPRSNPTTTYPSKQNNNPTTLNNNTQQPLNQP